MKLIKLIKVKRVDDTLLEEIIKRILSVVDPIKIILFGSYAYGEPKRSSDLDILVVMENTIGSRRKVASEIYGSLCGILIPKDVIVVTLNDIEEYLFPCSTVCRKIFKSLSYLL
jgi:predicted nucleotidyltransferase